MRGLWLIRLVDRKVQLFQPSRARIQGIDVYKPLHLGRLVLFASHIFRVSLNSTWLTTCCFSLPEHPRSLLVSNTRSRNLSCQNHPTFPHIRIDSCPRRSLAFVAPLTTGIANSLFAIQLSLPTRIPVQIQGRRSSFGTVWRP